MTQEWIIALFSIAGAAIFTAIFNVIGYFLKKKDNSIDHTSQALSAIQTSVQEIRNLQFNYTTELASLKNKVGNLDAKDDIHEQKIRNIMEALRIIRTAHFKCEKETLDFGNLLD